MSARVTLGLTCLLARLKSTCLIGRIADGVTLREHFEKAEKLSEIGGARYLEQLLDSAAFGAEVGDYAHMIRDLAMRRSLVGIGSDLQGRALTPAPEESGERQIELAELDASRARLDRAEVRALLDRLCGNLEGVLATAIIAFRRSGYFFMTGVGNGPTFNT